jgi:DNA-binding MarR family transcriptional regulator
VSDQPADRDAPGTTAEPGVGDQPADRDAPGTTAEPDDRALTAADYENLLAFRTSLRKFLRWSEASARVAGLTPAQHQLLLAVKGHPGGSSPAVGDLADHLLLRHHSAVELIDRAEAGGLVERWRDTADGRVIRVRLTPGAEERLSQLSAAHLAELRRLAPVLDHLVTGEP